MKTVTINPKILVETNLEDENPLKDQLQVFKDLDTRSNFLKDMNYRGFRIGTCEVEGLEVKSGEILSLYVSSGSFSRNLLASSKIVCAYNFTDIESYLYIHPDKLSLIDSVLPRGIYVIAVDLRANIGLSASEAFRKRKAKDSFFMVDALMQAGRFNKNLFSSMRCGTQPIPIMGAYFDNGCKVEQKVIRLNPNENRLDVMVVSAEEGIPGTSIPTARIVRQIV